MIQLRNRSGVCSNNGIINVLVQTDSVTLRMFSGDSVSAPCNADGELSAILWLLIGRGVWNRDSVFLSRIKPFVLIDLKLTDRLLGGFSLSYTTIESKAGRRPKHMVFATIQIWTMKLSSRMSAN